MPQVVWSLLLVTLPTQPNGVRLRIWRALKALGCAALRDGAGLLPASQVVTARRLHRLAGGPDGVGLATSWLLPRFS